MPITKNCIICGKEFKVKPSHTKQQCCSMGCRNIKYRKYIKKNCLFCEKKFNYYPNYNSKKKFCSMICFRKYQYKTRILKTCLICGKEFKIAQHELKENKKYCSYRCAGISKRKNKLWACLTCGREFRRNAFYPKYCSRLCYLKRENRKERKYTAQDYETVMQLKAKGLGNRKISKETGILFGAINNWIYHNGKIHMEHSKRLSEIQKKVWLNPIHRQRIIKAHLGIPLSKEHKQKLRLATIKALQSGKIKRTRTDAELRFKVELEKEKIPFVFQYNFNNKFLFDFAIPEKKLLIEIDGGIHNTPKQKVRDRTKERYAAACDWIIIRFKNEEVFNNINNCIIKLKELLGNISL